ncbi:hypothetical protein [Spirosoma endophyticum]|uniref:Uncharacterized protein n=1 Tax=Spirosoma endophyticum TaxID=662367 RepID=A0A1I1QDH4_9BACT|nr:hypothetical protein [Spirosoma endophyticum]SFD16180.1 hypothetical protein SAMN05216167_103572 [Spirosoma endophyticum]
MTGLTTEAIIQRIADLQEKSGLFPSVRSNATLKYRRADTNIFFTASTVFVLQKLRPHVSDGTKSLIDRILERAENAYGLFRNKDGLTTYNFWPTCPSKHFPNGYLFHRFEHFRIPDDIDDTAMVYLTINPSRTDQLWLKNKLSQHANMSQGRQIQNTYPDYRDLRAYSTWFGKNMGIDFDACALSNMLYCIYQFDLPRNQHDTDSLTYLRAIVESDRYVSEPFRCAPHYARTSLIIYHLARLMAAFNIPELEPIRPRLIADGQQKLVQATNRVEQILLSTALLRLGEKVPKLSIDGIEQDFTTFNFFIAGLLTAYEQPLLRRFADRSIVQMRWQCEAHCWALVAEYVVLMINDE